MDNFAEITKTWEQFKGVLDVQEKELKKYGDVATETKTTLDKLNIRLDELEVKLNRPLIKGVEGKEEKSAEVKAFINFLRKGDKVSPDEVKLLSTIVDTEGGYAVPTPLRDRIIEKLVLISPVRAVASVETISIGNGLEIPTETGTMGGDWVGEKGARTETGTIPFGLERILVNEMYANPRATQSMLEDAVFDIEKWLVNAIAKKFAQLEGTAFISGDGLNKPQGILSKSGVTSVISGNANLLTADGLIDLYHALPEAYAKNGVWLLKRATLGIIRKFKDAVSGAYLWQPGLLAGVPNTILGNAYIECPDMPAVSAGTYPIVFGDIESAYLIVDKKNITMTRDIYSAKPYVEFYTVARVGGQVVNTEAIVKQFISAS